MEQEEFKYFIKQVEGLCSAEDCFFIYSLVRNLKLEGDILDIGSFKGRVAIALARGLIDSGQADKVYALEVNFFGTKERLLRNIEHFGLNEVIIPIFKHSSSANKGWDKKLKLIWVDTDANFLSGKCDFILWEPYLVKGGVLAFSCASSPRIKRLVENHVIASKRFERIETRGAVVYAYKNKEAPFYARWKITYTRILYILYYYAKKVFYGLTHIFWPSSTDKDLAIKKMINRFFETLLRI